MPTSGTISYSTYASSAVEGDDRVSTTVPVNRLEPGPNVLAVEVHQRSASSSDISFDAELTQTGSTGGGYGFFVMSDVHATSSSVTALTDAIDQMEGIDPHPIAGIAAGDLTMWGTSGELAYLNTAIQGLFDRTAIDFGGAPMYLSALGNHDVKYNSSGWYEAWNSALSGQAALGMNSEEDGIYFAVEHDNSLFVALDAQHTNSISDQTDALTQALSTSNAEFKFLFWHDPVYPCWADSAHPPFGAALPWVDIAEQYGVDMVFTGHTHVYSRSCPKYAGNCADDGVVYVETGSLGSTSLRVPTQTTFSVSGTDASGQPRAESYKCVERSVDPTGHLDAKLYGQNTFCHVTVDGCAATTDCYEVGASQPFDSWTIDHCE